MVAAFSAAAIRCGFAVSFRGWGGGVCMICRLALILQERALADRVGVPFRDFDRAVEDRLGVRSRALLLPVAWFATFSGAAHAFVAAGDRVFPGILILPQIAPTDEAYIQGATPFGGTAPVPSNVSRRTDAIWFFGKTLTE